MQITLSKRAIFIAGAAAAFAGCGTTTPASTPPPTGATLTIASLAPDSAVAGGPGFTLTVSGASFTSGAQVQWDGSGRTTTFVSSSQLQAAITAGDLATPGTNTITVVNPGGGTSGGVTFTVAVNTPSINSLSPRAALAGGPGFIMTLNGTNFSSGAQVQWNGNGRTTTFVSSSKLQAAVTAVDLATPGTNRVTVVNPAPSGGTSGAAAFAVNPIRITFESTRAVDGSNSATTGSTQNVWVMDPDGSSAAALTRLTFGRSFRPAWSHDGGKIVFSSTRPLDGTDVAGPSANLWLMNADGSGLTPLTSLTANLTVDLPSFSPDDSKILYSSDRALDGTDSRTSIAPNLWVANADGSGGRVLTNLTQSFLGGGVWSPDGTKIAYLSSRALDGTDTANTNGVQNLWIMNADGSGSAPVTRLTGAGAQTTSFSWSPDGSEFVTLANRAIDGGPGPDGDNTLNLWVVKADGSSATLVTPTGQTTAMGSVTVGAVAWSPEGSKIVFCSSIPLNGISTPNSAENLWIMNPDGTGAAPLSGFAGLGVTTQFPVWSADSTKIFFSSDGSLGGTNAPNLNDTANIWVVKTDGSAATPLTRLTAAGASSTFPNHP
jgi:Tol biopolymer transport system component